MKIRCCFLFLIFVLCTVHAVQAQGNVSLIQADSLRYFVQAITHDSTEGRMTGSRGAGKAAVWLANKFAQIGLKPVSGMDGYFQVFDTAYNGMPISGINVVGAIAGNGQSNRLVIISSHFDHLGTYQQNAWANPAIRLLTTQAKDSIFNGANDDASGVAAMLMLAKYFQSCPPPNYTIIFVAFSGEELGMLGSESLAAFTDSAVVKQVINLEMLGRARGASHENKKPFVTFNEADKWVIDEWNANYNKANPDNESSAYFLYDEYKTQGLYKRSDNYPFSKLGIPANSIMLSNATDKYYHHYDDEWDTLDYDLMESVVRAIALAIAPNMYK